MHLPYMYHRDGTIRNKTSRMHNNRINLQHRQHRYTRIVRTTLRCRAPEVTDVLCIAVWAQGQH